MVNKAAAGQGQSKGFQASSRGYAAAGPHLPAIFVRSFGVLGVGFAKNCEAI
jgi:hypothetical protein